MTTNHNSSTMNRLQEPTFVKSLQRNQLIGSTKGEITPVYISKPTEINKNMFFKFRSLIFI